VLHAAPNIGGSGGPAKHSYGADGCRKSSDADSRQEFVPGIGMFSKMPSTLLVTIGGVGVNAARVRP
jgi:hypothetical protein